MNRLGVTNERVVKKGIANHLESESCEGDRKVTLEALTGAYDNFWYTGRAWRKVRCFMCRSCSSNSQTQFGSEIMIHFSGLNNLDKPPVMVFPRIVVCLECGVVAEFTIPPTELRVLGERAVPAAA
jgi:hypothetical protein